MKGTTFVSVLLVIAAAPVAHGFVYSFEGLATGSIVGQDGWSAVEAGTASALVDNTIFSPMGGSTQSLRMTGGTTSTRIARFLGQTYNAGVVHVGYDMYHSPRIGSTSNLTMGTLYYNNGTTTQIFQPYAQNGGGAGAAQNTFTDTDGLGGSGYGGTGWIDQVLTPEHWYRLEFDIDFVKKTISGGTIYDIASGTKTLLKASDKVFYLNNNGTNTWYDQLDRIGVRLAGQTTTGEGWNIDNFSIQTVPEPGTMAILGLGALALIKRRRK